MFNSEYYFEGKARWSFLLGHPGTAATILVSVIGLLWLCEVIVEEFKFRRNYLILLLGLEFFVLFALFKTYSRGPVLSVFVSGLVLCIVSKVAMKRPVITAFSMRLWSARGVVFGLLAFCTSFVGRVAPEYLKSDGSAINRLDVWRGGLKLAVDNPISGWDFSPVGFAYVNWYQSLENDFVVLRLVNSYITIAAENGLAVLGLFLLLPGFTCFCVFRIIASAESVRCSTVAIVLVLCTIVFAYAVGIFFNDYIKSVLTLMVPGASILCILGIGCFCLGIRIVLRSVILGFISTLFVCVLVYVLGNVWLDNNGLTVSRDANMMVLTPSSEIRIGRVALAPDPRVVGRFYGRFSRKYCIELKMETLVPFDARADLSGIQDCRLMIAMGSQWEKLQKPDVAYKSILLCPIGVPRGSLEQVVGLILPEIDNSRGEYDLWLDWARQRSIPVEELQGVGGVLGEHVSSVVNATNRFLGLNVAISCSEGSTLVERSSIK